MNQRPFLRIFTVPAALCALGFVAAMAAVLQYSLRAYIPGSLDAGGFTLVNFLDLLKPLYARVFLDTVLICALTAIVTLLVGYPLAYALVHIERPWIKSAKNGSRHLLIHSSHLCGSTTIFNDSSSGCNARSIPSLI